MVPIDHAGSRHRREAPVGTVGQEREGPTHRAEEAAGGQARGPEAPEGVPMMLAHGGTICPLELLALPALAAWAWGAARWLREALKAKREGSVQ